MSPTVRLRAPGVCDTPLQSCALPATLSATDVPEGTNTMTAIDSGLQQAMTSLLHPRRIALIGASPQMGFANSIQIMLEGGGYDGELLPINPRYDEILGRRCYPSLAAIPGQRRPRHRRRAGGRLMLDVLEQLRGQRRRRGQHHLQRLRRAGRRPGGVAAPARDPRLRAADRHPRRRAELPGQHQRARQDDRLLRPVQPVAAARPARRRASERPARLQRRRAADRPRDRLHLRRHLAATRPTSTRPTSCATSSRTTRRASIGAFIEQFRDPAKLLAVAELAAERRKPIVVLKIGRSEAGGARRWRTPARWSARTASPTRLCASTASSASTPRRDERDAGHLPQPSSCRRATGVASTFVSGGAAGLTSDLAPDVGLRLPDAGAGDGARAGRRSSRPTARSATRSTTPARRRSSRKSWRGCLSRAGRRPQHRHDRLRPAYPGHCSTSHADRGACPDEHARASTPTRSS